MNASGTQVPHEAAARRSLAISDRVDMDRYWSTLERSSSIGKGRANGLRRLALTDGDKEMRDLFVHWCAEAGMAVTIDRMFRMACSQNSEEQRRTPDRNRWRSARMR